LVPCSSSPGFDAIEVQGIATEEVMVFIDGNEGLIQIIAAPEESVNSTDLAKRWWPLCLPRSPRKAGHQLGVGGRGRRAHLMGCLNFSFYDPRREVTRLKQAGRGGIGTVLRHKKVKALVVKYAGLSGDSNHPDDLESIQETGAKMHREIYQRTHHVPDAQSMAPTT
jgi:aldehyde:ferredoxin oxidoreductase